ncbi:hypothetical protein OEZ86_005640 [Tetradesmus obliquus]|nr:hypothetical protein OEZ86_005640 [Tetradesmus obliquus]
MHYEPVTSDKSYTYYRIKVNLNEAFFDTFTPDPKEAHLSSTVVSADVFDNSTGIKVGTFDTSSISTFLRVNSKLQWLATMAVELGPSGDDTLFVSAALDRANLFRDPTDFD